MSFHFKLGKKSHIVEMGMVEVSQEQNPAARFLILCLGKVLVRFVLLRFPL